MTNGCIGIKIRKIIMIHCRQCEQGTCQYIGHISIEYPVFSREQLQYLAYRYYKNNLFEFIPVKNSELNGDERCLFKRKYRQFTTEQNLKIFRQIKHIDNKYINSWCVDFLIRVFIINNDHISMDNISPLLYENALKKMKKKYPYLGAEINYRLNKISKRKSGQLGRQLLNEISNMKLIISHIINNEDFSGYDVYYDGASCVFKSSHYDEEKIIRIEPSIYKRNFVVISIDDSNCDFENYQETNLVLSNSTENIYFQEFDIKYILDNKDKFSSIFHIERKEAQS